MAATRGSTPAELGSEACKDVDAALARAFEFLGKRWNAMILAALASGPAGFAGISREIEPISDSVLSGRLSELTRAGLVARDVDAGPPVSVTYSLTPSAVALIPALQQIAIWARENLTD